MSVTGNCNQKESYCMVSYKSWREPVVNDSLDLCHLQYQ